MLKQLDHIGIAVNDLESSAFLYRELLGLEFMGEEELPAEGVKTLFFNLEGVKIELLAGTGEDNPISKFVTKRGEGIHHLAFMVEDLATRLEELREKGVRLIDKKPRPGAGGKLIAFLHPRSTGGVLIELCEKPVS